MCRPPRSAGRPSVNPASPWSGGDPSAPERAATAGDRDARGAGGGDGAEVVRILRAGSPAGAGSRGGRAGRSAPARGKSLAGTETRPSAAAEGAPEAGDDRAAQVGSLHFSDRLLAAIEARRAPICVGIDPVAERLPEVLRRGDRLDTAEGKVAAIYEFCIEIIDAVADIVPAVKFQSACFERYRHDGFETLFALMEEAKSRGLIVIADAKRGDIGISAAHYAAAFFEHPEHNGEMGTGAEPEPSALERVQDVTVADALTINPYLGMDGVEPFCRDGRGAFALVRTSNAGGNVIQQAKMASGETVSEFIAAQVEAMGQAFMGESGYSDLGAVVGATHPDEITRLRSLMPHALFLVPGYGAQGGKPEDVSACFNRDGRGAIITASRSVIYAYEQPEKHRSQGRSVDAAAKAGAEQARAGRETQRGGRGGAPGRRPDPLEAAMTGAGDSPRWIDHIAEAAAAFAHEIREIVGR